MFWSSCLHTLREQFISPLFPIGGYALLSRCKFSTLSWHFVNHWKYRKGSEFSKVSGNGGFLEKPSLYPYNTPISVLVAPVHGSDIDSYLDTALWITDINTVFIQLKLSLRTFLILQQWLHLYSLQSFWFYHLPLTKYAVNLGHHSISFEVQGCPMPMVVSRWRRCRGGGLLHPKRFPLQASRSSRVMPLTLRRFSAWSKKVNHFKYAASLSLTTWISLTRTSLVQSRGTASNVHRRSGVHALQHRLSLTCSNGATLTTQQGQNVPTFDQPHDYCCTEGDYDGVVHAIGMLFASSLNRFASGSGSVPDPGTTYDKITRQTAFAATAALDELARGGPQVRDLLWKGRCNVETLGVQKQSWLLVRVAMK